MSDMKTARAELQKALKAYRAFEAADAALAVLENFEQVEAERKAAAEAAQQTLTTVNEACALAQRELKSAKDEAKAIRAAAREQSVATITEAKDKAAQIMADASERVMALQRESDALTNAIAELQKTHANIRAKVDEAATMIERAERMRAALSGV